MGIANVHAVRRGTLAVVLMATVALLIMLAAMAVGGSLATQDAQALSTFNTAGAGLGPCNSCHTKDAIHAGATHAAQSCSRCHTSGTSTPPLPSACATCHTKAGILAKATHTSIGCGTAGGCHAAAPVVVTTTLTAKVAPTSVKVKKSVKVTGTAGPAASLAGAKVALKVERKVGKKWTKMKTGKATASATGAFTWSYKAAKKGAHRVTASIAATSTYTAKKVVKTFKVK